jgi:hypothetical protein
MATDTTAPAQAGGEHDKLPFRDALGLIELLHQRVQDAINRGEPRGGAHGSFCTVFNCMDGRCQRLVQAWCERELNVEYVDTITIAGCDKVFVCDAVETERAFRMAQISTDKHGARDAVVVGHSSCAGNPVSEDQHFVDVERAAAVIAERGLFRSVTGLFVDVDNKRVDLVCRTPMVADAVRVAA